MRNSFTLLKVLDQLAINQVKNTKKFVKAESSVGPKKETISNIIWYANSLRCYKTRLIDKVLLVLN